jgi:hypothetical protein
MEIFEYLGFGIPAVVIGLMELLKGVGVSKRIIPFINIGLTVAIFTLYVYPSDIKTGVYVGIIASLTSMGLFNASKSTVKGIVETTKK